MTKAKIDIKINFVVIPNVVMLMICKKRKVLCVLISVFFSNGG